MESRYDQKEPNVSVLGHHHTTGSQDFNIYTAHRQNKFDHFVAALEALAPWFFALDHVNSAR